MGVVWLVDPNLTKTFLPKLGPKLIITKCTQSTDMFSKIDKNHFNVSTYVVVLPYKLSLDFNSSWFGMKACEWLFCLYSIMFFAPILFNPFHFLFLVQEHSTTHALLHLSTQIEEEQKNKSFRLTIQVQTVLYIKIKKTFCLLD